MMDQCEEDGVSKENRLVVERIKSAIDGIKHSNGLVDSKDSHIKRNGDVFDDVSNGDLVTKDRNDHVGKGDHIGKSPIRNGDVHSTENGSEVVNSPIIDLPDENISKVDISDLPGETVPKEDITDLSIENVPKEDISDLPSENVPKEDIKPPEENGKTEDVKDTHVLENGLSEHSINNSPTKTEAESIDSKTQEDETNTTENIVKTVDKTKSVTIKKFILNDKIRNSLKGLQDKIKSSPDKKPDAEQDKSYAKSLESGSNTVLDTLTIEDKNEEIEEEIVDDASEPNSCEEDNSKQLGDSDDVLLGAGSEGTPMEIGSDDDANEDDLLELSDDSAKSLHSETKCNITKTNLSIFNDKVQFDEDSNSNSNSTNTGKINEIVNFLNTDLSNTKSPLTISQAETGDQKKDLITILDDDSPVKIETVVKQIKELGSNLVETEKELIEICQKQEKENELVDTKECDSSPAANDNDDEVVDDDDDDVIICDSETRPDSRNSNLDSKLNSPAPTDDPKLRTITSENTESCMEEDDDDVIFEKEVKISAGTDTDKLTCDKKQSSPEQDRSKENNTDLESKTVEDIRIDSSTEPTADLTEKSSGEDNSITKSADKKRRAESDSSECEGESKRSKLDLGGLIGKLGSRVQPTSIEVSDSEEEEEEEEEEEDCKSLETETADSDEAEVKKNESENDNQKYMRITEKELEALVREKVKSYLTAQRDKLIVQLSQKVKELQENNDLWKRQVKDLQSKVNDVTVLQQKLEERKAKTDALRQITKRSVAIQVDDGRTSSGAHSALRERLASKILSPSTPTKPSVNNQQRTGRGNRSPKQQLTQELLKPPVLHTTGPMVAAPPGANGTIRLPIAQTSQPMMTQQISSAQVGTYKAPSVKSLLDTTRMQPTVSSAVVSIPTSTATSVINLVQLSPRMMTQNASSQGQYITVPANTISQAVTKVVSRSSGTVTTIDLTDDDDMSRTRVVTLPPGLSPINPQMPGMRAMLPPGTQIIRSPMSNSSQPQYQLVFNTSSSPSLQRSGVMTAVPSMPQTGTLIQTLPQNSVVTMSSPSALPPGASLPRSNAPLLQIPTSMVQAVTQKPILTHPAPFPPLPANQATVNLKLLPPKPSLKISRGSQGIVLSWTMTIIDHSADISNYQLFAYQESAALPSSTLWKKVGDVKALPLPMACTLTQFQVGNKYHFAVRAMDTNSRVGQFSDPSSIHLTAAPVSAAK